MTAAEQRLAALAAGNAVRTANAEFKRRLGRGEIDPLDCALTCDAPLTVGQFLRALPKIGPDRAHKIAKHSGVSLDRRFDGRPTLTESERLRLIAAMGRHKPIQRIVER